MIVWNQKIHGQVFVVYYNVKPSYCPNLRANEQISFDLSQKMIQTLTLKT